MKFDQAVLDALPPLARGAHNDAATAVCAMEALARACGYGTTDAPACASPLLRQFVVLLNDRLPDDAARDRIIRPHLPSLVGTAGDGKDDARMWLMVDRAVRTFAPLALDAASLAEHAKTLRALPPVIDPKSAEAAARAAARAAAGATARAAAGATDAAWAAWAAAEAARAAEAAARAAARAAAGATDAAWAAWAAAEAAAGAAEAAARAAARAAAGATYAAAEKHIHALFIDLTAL